MESRYDIHFMKVAKLYSDLSYAKKKKVGAVIVQNNSIISDGYNGTPSGYCNTCEDSDGKTYWYVLHAEANAITKCSCSCKGSTLYITLSPCKECSKLIIQSGISRVVYNEEYRDSSGIDFLREFGITCKLIDI